ncbi:MAG TPA: MoaD/ThiS family protein [Candidatus Lokiarchaeia archaeon]|nr:MoaD/ThiS family protein [Candidatus Lokiarchaeia archaeon]
MQITVKYLGGISLVTQVERETIQTPDTTLGAVLQVLLANNGEDFELEVCVPGTRELKEFITIVLNGQAVPQADFDSTEVSDGDEIVWLPPILGG